MTCLSPWRLEVLFCFTRRFKDDRWTSFLPERSRQKRLEWYLVPIDREKLDRDRCYPVLGSLSEKVQPEGLVVAPCRWGGHYLWYKLKRQIGKVLVMCGQCDLCHIETTLSGHVEVVNKWPRGHRLLQLELGVQVLLRWSRSENEPDWCTKNTSVIIILTVNAVSQNMYYWIKSVDEIRLRDKGLNVNSFSSVSIEFSEGVPVYSVFTPLIIKLGPSEWCFKTEY